MGTISAIRLININYNNGGIQIGDETFHLNGVSTLLSLQNGGGKSVLVQMITAPFVHKAYRRVKDRPFEDFFTGTRPSFILIEWMLDGDGGRLMNGFMIQRRARETAEEGQEQDTLEILGLISAYREPCMWDIHNLPVVEKTGKEMKIRQFSACRQLFEDLKKDRQSKFMFFDIGQSVQQRLYFEKLREYKIDYKEWEEIIKKVNLKEGGLAELFADCKDERGLVDQWFLKTVEKKLDLEGSRMQGFAQSLASHARQCWQNEGILKRREDIHSFRGLVAPEQEEQAQSIRSMARSLLHAQEEIRGRKQRITGFVQEMNRLEQEVATRIGTCEQTYAQKREEMEHLVYERFSADIHSFLHDKDTAEKNRSLTSLEMEGIERALAETERLLQILDCSRLDERRLAELQELENISARLRAARQQDEEMAPRREALGRQLYVAYRSVCRDTKEDVSRKEALAEQLRQQQEEKQQLLQETEESIGRADQTLGSLRARIAAYDETEEAYHSRYGMSFQRNVLGRYEEGILAIAQEELERERQQCTDTLKQTQTELDRREKKEQKYISDLSDRKLARQALLHEQAENEEEYRALTEEKDTRREIVRFLQLGLGDTDDDFYDTSGLLAACDRRISEQDVRIRALEEQETRARDELQALEQDRLGELPEHLREGLERLDIPILYGLEWLRRNQKEPSDNLKLVHRNPFLPYALIMTEGEYQRLQKEADELYTSMPVPILLRQDLEQGIMPEADPNTAERLVTLEGHLRFFIHFHEDLLDEEKRDRLICRKQDELNKLHQQLEVRRGERDETIRRRETLRMQRLTLALMEQISKHLAMLQEKLKNSEQELQQLETEREENRQRIQALRKEEIALEERQLTLEDQVHQLETLRARYEQYLKDLVERELLNTERAGLMERKALTRDSIRKCQKECAETEREISLRRRDLEEAEENCRRYESFIPDGDGEESIPEPDREQLMAMEAEYRAITEELSGEVRLLEQSRDHQKERLQRVTEELSAKCRKNGLNADDWAQHPYRQEEEEEGHRQTKQLKQRLKEKETRFHMEDKQVSMLQTRIEDRLAQMQKETGRSAPLPEEEIIPRDYEEALKMLEYACKQLQEEERTLEKRRRDYQDASAGLEGTEEPASGEPLVWEEQFVSMSGEALKKFRTGLVRALDQAREERQKRRNVLSDALNLLLARELFRDPFFHKPLEAMLRMVDQPDEVLRQIELTLQAFDDQLAKAGAELRLIDDEKASIQSGLMDYLRDVHGEIGKIDSNSTIPVRDRTIRMLQITCPSWQENEELYRIRLEDRLKTIIAHCMSLHRAGERTEEYLGTQINIHALYDGVIGLQNIRIQLYKIEKEREYPIAWSDVAKNSGGEGFLSTFVILTSLLHYIRRDDNDLFADRNEGKVLLMDNPFGLTYSEHLLRPMMELAQKNHTQLICLSGLGGDAIYGRFDNIYVLNLVAARLRNGLQYLRSEHLRGTEPATILPSHIEVVEQQMKLF